MSDTELTTLREEVERLRKELRERPLLRSDMDIYYLDTSLLPSEASGEAAREIWADLGLGRPAPQDLLKIAGVVERTISRAERDRDGWRKLANAHVANLLASEARVKELEGALREVVDAFDHVRHCVDCGQTDARDCRDGGQQAVEAIDRASALLAPAQPTPEVSDER